VEGPLAGPENGYIRSSWEISDLEQRYAPTAAALTWNDGLLTGFAGAVGDSIQAELWPPQRSWTALHTEERLPLRWPREPDGLLPGTAQWRGTEPPRPGLGEAEFHPVSSPPRLALDALRAALRGAGIRVTGETVLLDTLPPPGEAAALLEHRSATLDSVLAALLATSSNGWTEQVAATVNLQARGAEPDAVLWPSVLDSLGVPARGLRAADACGMSRRNLVSALTVYEVLQAAHSRWGGSWVQLLPRADGVGNTLWERMVSLGDRLRAKTGALSGTRTLAGYLLDEAGAVEAVLVVLVNHGAEDPMERMDRFVQQAQRLLEEGPARTRGAGGSAGKGGGE
jgi:D-alanyl-D-alanine carboxypeptidase